MIYIYFFYKELYIYIYNTINLISTFFFKVKPNRFFFSFITPTYFPCIQTMLMLKVEYQPIYVKPVA